MNTDTVDVRHVVELKRAFVRAMESKLGNGAAALAEVRKSLGLPPNDSDPRAFSARMMEPLTRQEVREMIDKYVNRTGGANAPAEDANTVAKREAANLANRQAIPVRIGEQSFRLDKMAAELETAVVAEPEQSQAAGILKTLARPNGTVDIPALARSLNLFAFLAERSADADTAEGARDAGERFSAAFALALDSLDNGTLSQVYQGLISRDTDDLKNELSRRLAKFDLTAGQADACERLALALGRLESLVLSEIAHRVALGKAATDEERQETLATAPVLRHCGRNAARDLSARGTAGEMTSVNLEILANRAAWGNIHGRELTGRTDRLMREHGFTKADAHDIGDMIRKSELTVNAHLSNLLGWRNGQDPKNPPLFQPGHSLVNTFVSKERKGIAKDANGYLVRRDQVEKHYFPEYGRMPRFEGKDRPNYAAFNLSNAVGGAAPSYGNVVFVLKEHVKQQATYTIDDTFFAVKFDFTDPEAGKARFLASAGKFLSRFVKPEALAQLADPSSRCGAALETFFGMYSTSGICTGKGFDTDSVLMEILGFLNGNRAGGARELAADDLVAVLFDAIGVKEEEGARVAGYDDIENLLAGMEELDPVVMGLATVRRAANPGESVRVIGGEYIEAQLHGPIVVSRDVAEMRVAGWDISDHYNELADKDPSVTGGMDKAAWVAEQTAAEKERLLAFGRDNGFKVTFYDTTDEKSSRALETRDEDMRKVKEMLRADHEAFYREILANGLDDVFAAACRQLSTKTYRDLAAALFGKDLSAAPQWFADFAKAAAERTLATVQDVSSSTKFRKTEILESVVSYGADALLRVLEAVHAGRRLGATDDARLLELALEGIESGVKDHRLMKFVAAGVVRDRVAADPGALVGEALEKELSGRKDEIAALGIPGGFAIGGAAMKRILSKVGEYLANFPWDGKKANSLETCGKLVDEIREKIVAREIGARLDLLKALDGKPFPDDALKNSFFGWVLNAGRIKSAEELAGAKSGAEGFYASLSALLAPERDFGAPAFIAALLDLSRRIGEACRADHDANYQGGIDGFGIDDRNGYVSRAVSVGLGAIEAKMGRKALEKLGRILGSPAFAGLRGAIVSVAESGNGFDMCTTIFVGIADRLQNKYGIASMPVAAPQIDYSQVPPFVRSLLAAIDSDRIARADAEIPYAPQTARPTPPAVDPAAAPKTLAERKKALMGALPSYAAIEGHVSEQGRNAHGRGHATRVFVFANVLGNIMRERGVKVDMGLLSVSAAGHDMGRKGGGTDSWERDSGILVEQLAEKTYPGAYGNDWKAQANINVSAGHDAAADAQRSVEGLLMKAADSLDYTRIAPLDETRFHFLEKTMNAGGVHVMRDDNLRKALLHEAELLTKATSPLAMHREEIIRLKATPDESERLRGAALEADVTKAEFDIAKLTDEQTVERIEAEIRDNPAKYPLLHKYYFYGEESPADGLERDEIS